MNYRITKFDPARRNVYGHFLDDDWCAFTDLLKTNDFLTSTQIYQEMENKMIYYYQGILLKNNITKMTVLSLDDKSILYNDEEEVRRRCFSCDYSLLKKIKNKKDYILEDILEILRFCLRELLWCKFLWKNVYIHIGYDYYTYLGGVNIDASLITEASLAGIFIEEFDSPYFNDFEKLCQKTRKYVKKQGNR